VELEENWTEYAAFSDEGSLEMAMADQSWFEESIWKMPNQGCRTFLRPSGGNSRTQSGAHTLWRWIKAGRLDAQKVGASV
jgi:hypothetical protein